MPCGTWLAEKIWKQCGTGATRSRQQTASDTEQDEEERSGKPGQEERSYKCPACWWICNPSVWSHEDWGKAALPGQPRLHKIVSKGDERRPDHSSETSTSKGLLEQEVRWKGQEIAHEACEGAQQATIPVAWAPELAPKLSPTSTCMLCNSFEYVHPRAHK